MDPLRATFYRPDRDKVEIQSSSSPSALKFALILLSFLFICALLNSTLGYILRFFILVTVISLFFNNYGFTSKTIRLSTPLSRSTRGTGCDPWIPRPGEPVGPVQPDQSNSGTSNLEQIVGDWLRCLAHFYYALPWAAHAYLRIEDEHGRSAHFLSLRTIEQLEDLLVNWSYRDMIKDLLPIVATVDPQQQIYLIGSELSLSRASGGAVLEPMKCFINDTPMYLHWAVEIRDTYYELVRGRNGLISLSSMIKVGLDRRKVIFRKFIGATHMTDEALVSIGERVISAQQKYDLIFRNCQQFAEDFIYAIRCKKHPYLRELPKTSRSWADKERREAYVRSEMEVVPWLIQWREKRLDRREWGLKGMYADLKSAFDYTRYGLTFIGALLLASISEVSVLEPEKVVAQ